MQRKPLEAPVALLSPIQSSMLSNQASILIPNSYKAYSLSHADRAYVSRPFIDKIVMVGKITANDITPHTMGMDAIQTFHDLVTIPTGWFHQKGHGYHHPKKPVGGYVCGQKNMGPNLAPVLWCISKHKGGSRNVRLEFNPARLGKAGLVEIENEWALMFAGDIAFSAWLGRATVSALDVAVDLVNVAPFDLLVSHATDGKWSHFHSSDHVLETTSKWSTGSKRRPVLCVYDKRREQIERDEKPIFGIVPHTRIECRLHNKKRAFHKLATLPSPFELTALKPVPLVSSLKPYLRLLLLASQFVGLKHALAAAPKHHRAKLLKWIGALPGASFWCTAQNWQRWQLSLKVSGMQRWIDIANAKC